jgi:cation diffusion facilitator family transporter
MRVLVLTLVLNLFVSSTKIVIGMLTGLLSVTASGFESLLDSSNNIVGFITLSMAKHGPDERHPYGHRKFETLAALLIAVMLLIAGSQIFIAALRRLHEAPQHQESFWAFVAMAVSIGVNIIVIAYEVRMGKKHSSEFLLTDAAHTSTDLLSSIVVIVGVIGVRFGYPMADAYAAFIIVAVIGWTGLHLIREALNILSDSARIDPKIIEDCAAKVEGVIAVHNIRSRGTPDHIAVDMHVKVKPEMTVEEGHDLSHRVIDCITQEYPQVVDVVVHVEPYHPTPVS